jgi:hypothetical protein
VWEGKEGGKDSDSDSGSAGVCVCVCESVHQCESFKQWHTNK